MTKCSFILLAVLALVAPYSLAQSTTQPAGDRFDSLTVEQAEMAMLRRTIARQEAEIAALKAQVETLRNELRTMGIETSPNSATVQDDEDARLRPKRVVFVVATGQPDALKEVEAAIRQLDESQWFNVVLCDRPGAITEFRPSLQRGLDKNKEALEAFLPDILFVTYDSTPAIESAMRWRPEVIWYIGSTHATDEDAYIEAVKKANRGENARFYTTTAFCHTVEAQHFMWRLAHETDGICVDRNGQRVTEPRLRPPPAPAPPPEPRIIKLN